MAATTAGADLLAALGAGAIDVTDPDQAAHLDALLESTLASRAPG